MTYLLTHIYLDINIKITHNNNTININNNNDANNVHDGEYNSIIFFLFDIKSLLFLLFDIYIYII